MLALSMVLSRPEILLPAAVSADGTEPEEQDVLERLNILLVGIDNTDPDQTDEGGNADGILLVTLNPGKKELVLTSFVRDLCVRADASGYDKLARVYHRGGTRLLGKVLEENFDVRTDYYAVFSYLDVIDIVDSAGGIELTLSEDERYYMDDMIRNLCGLTGADYTENRLSDNPGPIRLNGLQTTAYLRFRPAEGNYDFGRTERARKVVLELLKKARELKNAELLHFAAELYQNVQTDIPMSLCLRLGTHLSELKDYTPVSDRIPIEDSYEGQNTGSGYYVYTDYAVNREHLRKSLYEGIHE